MSTVKKKTFSIFLPSFPVEVPVNVLLHKRGAFASLSSKGTRSTTSTVSLTVYELKLLSAAQFQSFTLNIVFWFLLRSVSNWRFRFANLE